MQQPMQVKPSEFNVWKCEYNPWNYGLREIMGEIMERETLSLLRNQNRGLSLVDINSCLADINIYI